MSKSFFLNVSQSINLPIFVHNVAVDSYKTQPGFSKDLTQSFRFALSLVEVFPLHTRTNPGLVAYLAEAFSHSKGRGPQSDSSRCPPIHRCRERMGFAVLWVDKIEDFGRRCIAEGNTIYIHLHLQTIYTPGACEPHLLWWLNPPKQGFFPIKTRVIWVPGAKARGASFIMFHSCRPKLIGWTWCNLTGIFFRFVAKKPRPSYITYCEPVFVSICVILSFRLHLATPLCYCWWK